MAGPVIAAQQVAMLLTELQIVCQCWYYDNAHVPSVEVVAFQRHRRRVFRKCQGILRSADRLRNSQIFYM